MNGNGTPATGSGAPFTAPTIGGNANNIASDLNSLAPTATSWGGPSVGVDTQQVVRSAGYQAQPSDLSKFGTFLGNIASETGHIASDAASWLLHSAVNMATAPIRLGAGFGNAIVDNMRLDDINTQNQQNSDLLANTIQAYKSGRMSKQAYQRALNGIAQNSDNLVKQSMGVQNQLDITQKATNQAMWDTASALVTVLTAGFGAPETTTAITAGGLTTATAQTAGDFLASKAMQPFLSSTADFISRVASQPEVFNALSKEAQIALQQSTAEVLSTATRMTASKIAQATAANVALKYPLTYGFIEPAATDFYHQLDNKQYGAAVQTLAFNAMLLLSGGAIGQALKYGGKALGFVSDRTFGQTSFWDELSKYYDQGQASGFRDAVVKMTDTMNAEEKSTFLRNLSAVEATNMAATGKDAIAAAKRVATGLTASDGIDLTTVTHEDALKNMSKFAEVQRYADSEAQKAGIGRVIVGRLDTRAKKMIATEVSKGEDVASRLKLWDNLKAQNPQQAWANNTNFDAQIKNMIANHADAAELQDAIKNIAARTTIKGMPQDFLDKMAADGYIPMKMKAGDAAFTEGSGKLVSSFAQEGDLWTKAVQPLPVLDNIGYMLTSIGMSPQNATQQVYQFYNETLATMLQGSDAAKSITAKLDAAEAEKVAAQAAKSTAKQAAKSADQGFTKEELALMKKQGITPELLQKGSVSGGENPIRVAEESPAKAPAAAAPHKATPQEVSDLMIKKLSSYAHNPTSGGFTMPNGVRIRAPITDLRQLTTNDIMKALDVSAAQAKEVSGALMDSMIQVPLDIRGLGGKIEDLNLKYNPTAKWLARTQGATRFAWNPFFQMKLAYKTEALSQLESGGKFPTILGTNKILSLIFPEHYAQLDEIRGLLRENGVFDSKPSGALQNVVSGEGVNDAVQYSANLTHKLLPSQERSIAGLVATQASKVNMDAQTFIQQFPSQVRDTVQMIAQYDRNNSFLNSPMARTLNFAFFPFRFEMKVASITANALAKTSPATQFAVIKGLYNGSNFLKSPEGQAWYAKNSDVIKLLTYFTPITTLNYFSQILGGKPDAVGSFGELGALPLGWIPQLLDAEGLTHISQSPYLDPKTGKEYANYIPATAKGALLIAVQELIGSLFTYPGAEAGLPSKTTIDRNMALELTGADKKTDLKQAPMLPLSPDQQQYQQTIQAMNGGTPSNNLSQGAPYQAPSISVPAQQTPLTNPLPKSTGSPKLKKSQFRPAPIT